ncbi:peptidyl-alpha-hydroxyglycine alpha-amidating lyase family protein [Chloroflexota bacterium]
MLYGEGKYTYELIDGWAKIPEEWTLDSVPGLFVDLDDRVYVFSRSDHPLTVFDRDGNLLTTWGEGLFSRPHGIYISPDGSVYCTDDGNHTARKFTPDGKELLSMGNKDQPSDTGYVNKGTMDERLASIKKAAPPFNCPTGIALSATGEIYVTDGYGNARVHKFSPDGTLLFSWGEPGTAPGQFRLPHHVWVDTKERVWICDRANSRIQIFNDQGEFLTQWNDFNRASAVFIDKNEETVYVAERQLRLSIFTFDGKLLARLGSQGQDYLGKTGLSSITPHAIAVDSRGDIYIGEINHPEDGTARRGSRSLRKFVRKG